jgi:hypothetical protein
MLNVFKTDVKTHIFTFYDKYIYFMICKYKFQHNAVLPKKACEVHFIASLNIFSVALP